MRTADNAMVKERVFNLFAKVLSLGQELSCTLPPLPVQMSGHTVDVVGDKVLHESYHFLDQPHESFVDKVLSESYTFSSLTSFMKVSRH